MDIQKKLAIISKGDKFVRYLEDICEKFPGIDLNNNSHYFDKYSPQTIDSYDDVIINEETVNQDQTPLSSTKVIRLSMSQPLHKNIEELSTLFTIESKDHGALLPIQSSFLKLLAQVPTDLYLKISDKKFIKVWNKDSTDKIEENDWFQKKSSELFFKKAEAKNLLDLIDKNFFKKSRESITESTYTIQEAAKYLGISKEIEEEVNHLVKKMEETYANSTVLANTLVRIWNSDNFKSKLSLLTAYLACEICQKSEELNAKIACPFLIKAAIFMDIGLPGEGREQIFSENQIQKLSQEQQNKLYRHPLASKQFLMDLSNLENTTLELIEIHHELPEGKGYPNKVAVEDLDEFHKLFIIAFRASVHATKLLEKNDAKNLRHKSVIALRNEGFNTKQFKEIMTFLDF